MKQTLSALEIRRQTFVLAILEGKSAADAARAAGYKGKDANMRIRAWALLRHPDIKAKIQEMANLTKTKTIATVTERLERLSEILRDDDPRNSVYAISEMNKMQRIYSTGPTVNVQQNTAVMNVRSEDTREKLLRNIEAIHKRLAGKASVIDGVTIESGDIKSGLLESRGSEEQNTKNSEVTDEQQE